ncbi:MAG: glycoside hydrolase family 3 C-terminal domain-containing protein [Phycisphaeraceae bacterium]
MPFIALAMLVRVAAVNAQADAPAPAVPPAAAAPEAPAAAPPAAPPEAPPVAPAEAPPVAPAEAPPAAPAPEDASATEAVKEEPPPPEKPIVYTNPNVPVAERVADLMSRMTLDEKAAQIDMDAPAIARLGVPAINWWCEGIHGVSRAGRATMFPQAIALAAMWDTDLMQRVAGAIGDEARAKNNENSVGRYRGLTYWAPCVNMARDPRWGRFEECYGEDPYHSGQMGVAFVKGMQGDDPRYLKTAATPKHLAVHSQETGRASTSFNASERVMFEYYFPAFAATVTQGKAVSAMTAFSGINKVPATMNGWLLNDVLRKRWGFEGAVVTDWGAVRNLNRTFHAVQSDQEAVAKAIAAGVDVVCDPKTLGTEIRNAVKDGWLTEAQLNEALARNLTIRFRLGMFDPPEMVKYRQYPPSLVGAKEHQALALESCRASIVLLKNQAVPGRASARPILPLERARLDSIAVLGPYADVVQLGAYSGDPANPAVSPAQGIRNRIGDRVIVRTVAWGKDEEALEAARLSDVVIIIAGLNNKIEREGHDRRDIDLPQQHAEFIKKIAAVNPATVLVIENGGPVACNWEQENLPAIMTVWYPGEQGGNGIADVLLGDANPAGRLPMTWYKSLDQIGPLDDYEISNGRTYWYFKDTPLYPFGHGLSYTSFAYSDLRIAPAAVKPDGKVTIQVMVKNTGTRDGHEVVQLYTHDVESSVHQPIKQLRGFSRVKLAAGESRTVTFTLTVRDLSFWDEATHDWKLEAGDFDVMVGASSGDIRQRGALRVE